MINIKLIILLIYPCKITRSKNSSTCKMMERVFVVVVVVGGGGGLANILLLPLPPVDPPRPFDLVFSRPFLSPLVSEEGALAVDVIG